MNTPKLPRFSNGDRPMTAEEFVYNTPLPMQQCLTVDRDQLAALLNRVHELEALGFAAEHAVKVSVEVDGRRVDVGGAQ